MLRAAKRNWKVWCVKSTPMLGAHSPRAADVADSARHIGPGRAAAPLGNPIADHLAGSGPPGPVDRRPPGSIDSLVRYAAAAPDAATPEGTMPEGATPEGAAPEGAVPDDRGAAGRDDGAPA